MGDASPAEHACAGTSASVIAMALLYPLDTVRIKLQVERSSRGHRTPWQVLREASQSPDGLASLYKGLPSTLFTVSVSQAIYFFWYNLLKQHVQGRKKRALSTGTSLAIAYAAGAINATLTSPMWTVATRLKLSAKHSAAAGDGGTAEDGKADQDTRVSQPHVYSGSTLGVMVEIAKREGIAALFQGVPSALLLCSNPAIQFLVYERLKSKFLVSAKHLTGFHSFMYGALAKAVATVLTYPLQVVQARANANSDGNSSNLAIASSLLKHEGMPGFFKGIESKLLQTVLNSAFIFLIYEKLLLLVRALTRRSRS